MTSSLQLKTITCGYICIYKSTTIYTFLNIYVKLYLINTLYLRFKNDVYTYLYLYRIEMYL